MARPRKRSRVVPNLPAREWAPLDEAFARIKNHVGSGDLVLRDLYRDLVREEDGLGSAERIVPFRGAFAPYHIREEVCRTLEPSYWLSRELRDNPANRENVVVWPRPREGRPIDGVHYYFVRRRDLDRLYPAGATSSDRPIEPQPPRRARRKDKRPTQRKGSRIQDAIKQGTAEEWPGGYEHVLTVDIIDKVSPKLVKRKLRVPHRSTWERALGRKKH